MINTPQDMRLDFLNFKKLAETLGPLSKNPHASLIIKWLFTNQPVQFRKLPSEAFVDCDPFPAWNPDLEYRFKPLKRAYRVYEHYGMIRTVLRFEDGTTKTEIPDGVNWLTPNWIEYDFEEIEWPTELTERISRINLDAAIWIKDNWKDIENKRYTPSSSFVHSMNCRSDKLEFMFYWRNTPQGDNYWKQISIGLGENIGNC